MVIQTFLGNYAFIWLFVIVVVLVYAALKKAGIPGSEMVIAITAFLIGFILLSSTKVTDYLIDIMPLLTVLLVITVLITVILIFVTSGAILDDFKKYLAWIGLILAVIIVIYVAFNHFPTLYHLTPNSSDYSLNSNERHFKDFIYSDNFKESIIFIIAIVVAGFILLKTTVAKK